jgi:hypothetical protein
MFPGCYLGAKPRDALAYANLAAAAWISGRSIPPFNVLGDWVRLH